jgi:hypothetical protein
MPWVLKQSLLTLFFSEPEFSEDELKDLFLARPVTLGRSAQEEVGLTDAQVEGLSKFLPRVGEGLFAEGLERTPTVLGYVWQAGAICKIGEDTFGDPEKIREARSQGLTPLNVFVDSLSQLILQSVSSEYFPPLTSENTNYLFFTRMSCDK